MTNLTNLDITRVIGEAVAAGRHSARITGEYEISDTVILPSDFTLILEDCCLRLADGVMVQIFRNAGAKPGEAKSAADRDHDIRLIGIGRAILDGGEYNGLSEKTSGQDGRPHISQNNMLLFSNVTRFEISHIQVRRQRWWALNLLFCDNGTIRDIDFCADDTIIDDDGNRVHGLYQGCYRKIVVKNADGVHLNAGCHDVLVENITGFCEDDVVALTNLEGDLDGLYGVDGLPRDMYNIVIRNIRACSLCAIIRLLNQSGARLYNVLIDGVFDSSLDSEHVDRGNYGIQIGDTHLYGDRQPDEDNLADVMIRNAYLRTLHGITFAGGMKNVVTENVSAFADDCILFDDRRTAEQ